MGLEIGSRVGVYEIHARLGAGGMGEVYRARDTALDRDVAIKVLPSAFLSDDDRLARFAREARVLASLNHPNIAGIYALEKIPDGHALVLELVDGETLAARIARGPVSVPQALVIARAIADALDAAHERGVVHRDLKPANVMVTRDGIAKVLDFGLAKPAAESELADMSRSPTVLDAATGTGVILGTAAYMSPEQARGQPVDKRADIWAFGCVLFEMLAGRAPFAGPTVTDTLARVIEREPDWASLPTTVPAHLRKLLQRSLTKDPKARLRDMGDLRHELQEDGVGGDRQSTSRRWQRHAAIGWITAAVLIALAVALIWLRPPLAPPSASLPAMRTLIDLPAGHKLTSIDRAYPIAVSPDGARLAFVSQFEGRTQLFVRELSELEAKPLPGTAGARQPFFSPDGRWIAFFAGRTLQKVSAGGGTPIRICDVPTLSVGGSWALNDTIVFATVSEGLSKVGAAGGVPERIENAGLAAWPDILPDGRTILYSTGVRFSSDALATINVDGEGKRIIARVSGAALEGPALLGTVEIAQARFVTSGHIVYGQSPGSVRIVPVDLASLTVTGSPASIVDSVERGPGSGAVYFALSQAGLLVYAPTGDRHQLVWVDRQGVETPISADSAAFRIPHVSPDGERIAVSINDEARRSDIWIYDAERGTRSRLTTEGHNLESPWTPDGTRITFSSDGIEEVAVDGPGKRVTLWKAERGAYPDSWSPDGQQLLFHTSDGASRNVMVMRRGDAPRPLMARPFNEWQGRLSPDGRWVAYTSDESGRYEIYVERFPELGGRVAVSTDGGMYPRWARDGHELFYRQGDALMATTVDTSKGFRAERPRRLFSGQYTGTGQDSSFDVSRDGRRFVMVKSDDASTLRQLTVVQNWMAALKRP